MTKEEVLQKVNDYCNEKSYTSETLTDGFKDKFAEHFQKANPDGDINEQVVLENLKFAINSAFSSASELATVKTNGFATKENNYKNQIAELKKQLGNKQTPKEVESEVEFKIPKELQDQLDELKKFKTEESKKEKSRNILKIAKQGIRQDLHKSFDAFASDFNVALDRDDKEQADRLVERFQAIFKDSIGDIKPLAPRQT